MKNRTSLVGTIARIGHASERNCRSNAVRERAARSLVEQINARYVQRICEGRSSLIPGCSDPAAWFELDRIAQEWIAGYPVLLLNLRFEDANWWVENASVSKCDQVLLGDQLSTGHELIDFTRHVLLVGWYTACAARSSLFLLGIPPRVANEISKLTFYDIDRNALYKSAYLRPRWDANGTFWAALLAAARDRDRDRWGELELHGLQLLGRDLLKLQ